MIKKWTRSLFIKFLISNTLILAIPILILSSILYTKCTRIFSDELMAKDLNALNTASHTLENVLDTCYIVGNQINSEPIISPFELKTDITKALDTLSLLYRYNRSHTLFDEIVLHYDEDNYFYSNSTSMTSERFYKQYQSQTLSPYQLQDTLRTIKTPTVISDILVHNEPYLIYAVPLIKNYAHEGVLLFLINQDKLLTRLGNQNMLNRQVYLLETNSLKSSLSSLNLDTLTGLSNTELFNILYNLDNTSTYITQGLNGYTLYASKPHFTNLVYLSLASNKDVFAPLNTIQGLILFSIFLSVILSILMNYFLMKRNYKPISQLTTYACNIKPNESAYHAQNDIDIIKHTLVALNEQNQKLQFEFQDNHAVRQYFLLSQLINGTIGDLSYFLKECAEIQLILDASYHAIVIGESKLPSSTIQETCSNVLKDVQNFSMQYIYLIQHIIPDKYIFLVGTSILPDKQAHALVSSSEYTFYIGRFTSKLNHLPSSYMEARSALDLQLSSDYPYDLTHFRTTYKQSLHHITHLLESNDLEATHTAILTLLESVEDNYLPFEIIRNIYLEIIVIFNTYFHKHEYAFTYDHIDLEMLYKIETIDSLKEVFNELLNDMFHTINHSEPSTVSKLSLPAIKECLATHYMDPSFSLQFIADEYKVSLSYLSQYFKDKEGVTILDYLTLLRMEKAKELLLTTNSPLKLIAEQIGYLNVSSFIRRFKQFTGTTPGEFKKMTQLDT